MRQTVGDKIQAPVSAPQVKHPVTQMDLDFAELRADIERAYSEGVSLEQAERLAAKVLLVQMEIANSLETIDLDARMKKSGLKAIQARCYARIISNADKKPTEKALEHGINADADVLAAQQALDEGAAKKESLSLYFGLFHEAHIYFRGISRNS